MNIKSYVLWIVGSAIPAFLAFVGLEMLSPIDGHGKPGFFFALILCVVLWLSFAALLLSSLCCAASLIFPNRNGESARRPGR